MSINHAAWSQLGSDWTGGNDLQHPAQPSPNIYTGQGSSSTSHWRDLHSAVVVVEFSNLDRATLGKSLLQPFHSSMSMEYNTQRRAGQPLISMVLSFKNVSLCELGTLAHKLSPHCQWFVIGDGSLVSRQVVQPSLNSISTILCS